MNSLLYYKIHANCAVVEGAFRSCLYDMFQNEYHIVPKKFGQLLVDFNGLKLDDLINACKNERPEQLLDWVDFIIEHDFIMITDSFQELNHFVEMPLDYSSYFTFNSLIIFADEFGIIPNLCSEIVEVLIDNVTIACSENINLSSLTKTLDLFNDSSVMSVRIVIKDDENSRQYQQLIKNYPRIESIILHSSINEEIISASSLSVGRIYTTQKSFELNPSLISENTFEVNIELYTETHHHNNYHNKKLIIDCLGFVRPFVGSAKNFGAIKSFSRADLLSLGSNTEFTTLWNVKKDSIEVCKVCEFRYMCVDNRIPVPTNVGSWYFENECNYNPFIGKWALEENYFSLTESGVSVELNGATINHGILHRAQIFAWNND